MGVKIVACNCESVGAGMICPRSSPMGLVAVATLTYHMLFWKPITPAGPTQNIWIENWFGLKTVPFMVPSVRATTSVPTDPAAPLSSWTVVTPVTPVVFTKTVTLLARASTVVAAVPVAGVATIGIACNPDSGDHVTVTPAGMIWPRISPIGNAADVAGTLIDHCIRLVT